MTNTTGHIEGTICSDKQPACRYEYFPLDSRCSMYDPRKHNYWKKLLKLFEQESNIFPGLITSVDVCHDDWCRIYRGGYCNCDPEIILRPPSELN